MKYNILIRDTRHTGFKWRRIGTAETYPEAGRTAVQFAKPFVEVKIVSTTEYVNLLIDGKIKREWPTKKC